MSDLISRQAAIDILYNFAGCVVDTPNGDYRRAYEASRHELETLPSAQPNLQPTCNQLATDAISRQATIDVLTFGKEILSRAMDAMNVVGPDREKYSWGIRLIESDIEDIKELPPAEPEIIRCKDCKHQVKEWRDDKRLKDKGYWVYGCKVISDICGYWAWFGQDDEFCSEAERRTDE